jgi:Tol biopolymer transport system component
MRFVKWSPDGRRLAYVRSIEKEGILESRDLKGGPATTILSLPEANGIHDYLWSPDGRIIYGRDEPGSEGKSCNYWEVRVDPSTGRPIEQPRPLTNWAGFVLDWTSISADGKRLAFVDQQNERNSYRCSENNGTHVETRSSSRSAKAGTSPSVGPPTARQWSSVLTAMDCGGSINNPCSKIARLRS